MHDSFYLRWILANGWSEALGLGTTFILGRALAPTLEQLDGLATILLVAFVAVVLGVILEGLLVGAAQAAVLRRRLTQLPSLIWIRTTMIGAGLAWVLGMVPSSLMALNPPSSGTPTFAPSALVQYAMAAGLGAVAGPILGLAQWTALRHRAPRATRWLWANALAWGIGMPVIFIGMDQVPWSRSPVEIGIAVFVVCGLAGLTVGAVHGAVLTTIVPSPSVSAAES